MNGTNRCRSALVALVVIATVALAACGGSSSKRGVASLSGSNASAQSSGSSKTSPAEFRSQLLAYAKCMRDNGVSYPDPTFDANGNPSFNRGATGGGGGGFDQLRNSPNFDKARTACQSKRPNFAGQFQRTPAEQAALRKNLLKFAACMRSKGVKYPDPTFDANGRPRFGTGTGGDFRDQNRNDPQFQSASTACRQQVGGQLGGGGRGFFGGGPGGGRDRGPATGSGGGNPGSTN